MYMHTHITCMHAYIDEFNFMWSQYLSIFIIIVHLPVNHMSASLPVANPTHLPPSSPTRHISPLV